jgi:hypothetical protein
MTKAEDHLRTGVAELESLFALHGFRFTQLDSGSSSGGAFARGEYRRGDRFVELHFRQSLGLISYHVGSASLGHEEYVRAVRAIDHIAEASAYPGFFKDSISEFRALADDLRRFGPRFLAGTDDDFQELQEWVDQHPKSTGLAALDDRI